MRAREPSGADSFGTPTSVFLFVSAVEAGRLKRAPCRFALVVNLLLLGRERGALKGDLLHADLLKLLELPRLGDRELVGGL